VSTKIFWLWFCEILNTGLSVTSLLHHCRVTRSWSVAVIAKCHSIRHNATNSRILCTVIWRSAVIYNLRSHEPYIRTMPSCCHQSPIPWWLPHSHSFCIAAHFSRWMTPTPHQVTLYDKWRHTTYVTRVTDVPRDVTLPVWLAELFLEPCKRRCCSRARWLDKSRWHWLQGIACPCPYGRQALPSIARVWQAVAH